MHSSKTGMKINALSGQLGETGKRSKCFADSQGISNSKSLLTKTKKRTKENKLFNEREGISVPEIYFCAWDLL